jgi:dihydrodipicolinate synthase/N-acetylneuraminate lyase
MHKYPKLHAALSTMIPSIRIPFHKNGAIDFEELDNNVDRVIENGAKALMLTYGDSLYTLLTDAEVEQVTEAVVRCNNGRVKMIASDQAGWTGKTVAFARYCRDLGVDILMVLPPDWAQSCTPDTLVTHYDLIAREIPVMLVTGYFRARRGAFGLEVVEQVHEQVKNVIAVKDDLGESFGREMSALVHDRWTVIAGGTKQLHLYLAPYGCQGHLSALIVYNPKLAHHYWHLVQSQDYVAAGQFIHQYEIPMFKILNRCPGGFDAGLHARGGIIGIYPRWRRPPYRSLADEDVETLAAGLQSIELL